MDKSDKKAIRKEYRKTIMFKNEEDKELFTKIIEDESKDKNMSPSEFLLKHLIDTILPTEENAKRFALWMYKGYKVDDKTGEHIKMNTYDVLSDIFGFIAGKVELNENFGKNMSLVYIMASFLRDSNLIINKTGDTYERLKNEITNLSNNLSRSKPAEISKLRLLISNFTCKYPSSFEVKDFLDFVVENYTDLRKHQSYYLSLSYFCRIISTYVHQDPENHLAVIKILKPLSQHWDMSPNSRNK